MLTSVGALCVYHQGNLRYASIVSIVHQCMTSILSMTYDHKECKKNASDLSEDIQGKSAK